jgi:LmbE family N-acetylglucosaminyl deacetylase
MYEMKNSVYEQRILVVSAHPDDEVLGAGGTLLKHRGRGNQVGWLITTSAFENLGYTRQFCNTRQFEIDRVSKAIGTEAVYKLDFPTTKLDTVALAELVEGIARAIRQFQPEILYLPNRSDAHSDHRITFNAVMSCTKSFRSPYLKRVLMYECLSETEFAPGLTDSLFLPNYFVDVTPFFQEKLAIADIYSSEMGEHPFPRSRRNIEALALFRGASCGVTYAEAFQLLKFIDK